MQCPIPADDGDRLAALRDYKILDTAPEHAFDRLTRLARMALRMPIVLVSLVDRDRQWFKSKEGLAVSETARSISFCGHAIHQQEPFIVSDATRDPLFRDNPLVTGEPFIRFYIGIPLVMRRGHAVGTLCAMDTCPRTISADEIEVMQELASMVVDAIELRRMATADSLTGALTRRGFEIEIGRELARAKRLEQELSLVALDIDHFKTVNDRFGHAAGDAVLQSVVAVIKSEVRGTDIVGRLGGEEFVLGLADTDLACASKLCERIRRRLADTTINAQGHAIRITASFGISSCDVPNTTWLPALANADAALYRAKRGGRNVCICHEPSSNIVAA